MLKKLALILALALFPTGAYAQAISLGQSPVVIGGSAEFSDSTLTLTFAGTPSSGSLICAGALFASTTAVLSSVTGAGATFTIAKDQLSGNAGAVSMYCGVADGSGAAITLNSSIADASVNIRAFILNFTCTNSCTWGTAGAFNAHVNGSFDNTGLLTTHNSGSTTPGTADNVCIGYLKGGNGSYTVEAGWTDFPISSNTRSSTAYLIQTSATAQEFSPTSAAGEDHTMAIACIDASVAAGGRPPGGFFRKGFGN
jgi:hypothetical protein